MLHFVRGVRGIDGGDRAAGPSRAVEGDRVLGDVWRHDGEHIALAKATRLETASQRFHRVGEFGVSQRASRGSVYQRRSIGQALGMTQHIGSKRGVRDSNFGKSAFVNHVFAFCSPLVVGLLSLLNFGLSRAV